MGGQLLLVASQGSGQQLADLDGHICYPARINIGLLKGFKDAKDYKNKKEAQKMLNFDT